MIYFTKNDFIENFNYLLKEFQSRHVDLEIADFLKSEEIQYKYAIDFLDLIIHPNKYKELPSYVDLNLFWDLMNFFDIDNHNIESYKDFCISFNKKSFEFNLDIAFNPKYQYLIMSWEKILKFLECDKEARDKMMINSSTESSLSLDLKKVYDPNYFNEAGFDLFLFFMDNYTVKKEQKIKYINIYFYMINEIPKNLALGKIYTFSFTQKRFKEFMLENYSIELKKMGTATHDFETQIRVLNSLESNFRSLYL